MLAKNTVSCVKRVYFLLEGNHSKVKVMYCIYIYDYICDYVCVCVSFWPGHRMWKSISVKTREMPKCRLGRRRFRFWITRKSKR